MDRKPLVSVVIPVFNTAPFLAEAFDSVIHQTYKNLEIIAVNDGSTDGSGEICEEYALKDPRFRLIHQQNKGVSSARNAGLSVASGDYLVFFDSDDALYPDCIKDMLSAAERERADLVLCRYILFHTDGKMIPTGNEKKYPAIAPGIYGRSGALQAFASGTINPMATHRLYRREIWERLRFPEGHVHEDITIAFSVLDQCETVVVLDQPLYMYRMRGGAITHTITKNSASDWLLSSSILESFIIDHTPEIFTGEHLRRVRQARLRKLINFYTRLSWKAGKEDAPFLDGLREQILEIGKDTELGDCGVRMKFCYQIIRFHPRMMRTACSLYYPTRWFITKLLTSITVA